jgi:hypothetical protein
MSTHFTTEIGRMRSAEMIGRAERYRRSARATQDEEAVDEARATGTRRGRKGLLAFVRGLASA